MHCGGAAVATTNADQRTFAADQNYSGGTAWDANGYSYTVDVSGVTNPAPQTAYQDQRCGNMSYTFNNYLPGTNYLVRLHCMEPVWTASGQRVFNVFINGQKVLANFDIFATAGAQNRAVIKQITTSANAGGQLVVGFSNVVDNACISGIEILQGGMYAPINLAASAGTLQSRVELEFRRRRDQLQREALNVATGPVHHRRQHDRDPFHGHPRERRRDLLLRRLGLERRQREL